LFAINGSNILATDASELELAVRQAQLSKECGVIANFYSFMFL
jgi:hypothetical protein